MSPEFWSIIASAIAISVAVATSNRALRQRIDALSERIDGLSERIDGLSERIDAVQRELGGRIDALSDRLGDVRERLGRVEGLLEGIGLKRREQDGKGRGDEEQSQALPPP